MQPGFKSGNSTVLSFINLQEQISTAVDYKFSMSIFIDLAETFDMVVSC